jgi:hypothetical protein
MRLYALSAGIEAPSRCFSGVIQGVFPHACTVRLERDAFFTLVSSEKGNLPNGIRLETPSRFTFLDQLRVEQPIACRGGILRVSGSDLSVDLRTGTPWHVNLKALRVDLHQPAQAQAWAVAWCELRRRWYGNELSTTMEPVFPLDWNSISSVSNRLLDQRGEHAVQVLLEATGAFRLHHALSALTRLIGLGSGLTPSGDDFLVGYLAGLWSTVGTDGSRSRFLTAMGSWVTEAAVTTNTISSAYLRSAVRGNVAEPVATLAQQLAYGLDMEDVRAATQVALSVGHTSGSAGVLGLLLGSLAWEVRAVRCRSWQPRLERSKRGTLVGRPSRTDQQEDPERIHRVAAASHSNQTQPVLCP